MSGIPPMAGRVKRPARQEESIEKMRLQTGISELDHMLCGGFLPGDAVLLSGGAGTGKTTLALEHLVNGATKFRQSLSDRDTETAPAPTRSESRRHAWPINSPQ